MKSAWLVIAAICLISTVHSSVKAQGSTGGAPSFTKKPSNTTAKLGTNALLQCEATGDPPPTTSWVRYKDGETPIRTSGRFIVGLVFRSLYILDVRWEDAGRYGCVAQNQHGRITANASVTVVTDTPPTWHIKPYNVTLFTGQKYTIPCRTFGYPVPIHTWTRDGLLVVETGVRPLLTDLYFSKAKSSLDGWYTCSASNIQGTVSQSIYVHVVSDPSIITQPLDMVTVRGATVTLSCGVVASERSLGVQWKKNDNDLPDDTRITTTRQTWHNTIWYTLKIKPARKRDLASYHCIVTNSKGSVTSNAATITFSGKPLPLSVAVPQPNVITTEGLDVDLVCVFLGSPIPQVTWFKDGQNWDGVGFRVIKVTTSNRCEATLKLGNVDQSLAGNYVCRGDGVSSTVNGNISLTVRGASFPYVTPVESHVLALKDSNVTLQCILTGSAMPDEVTWYKDGEEMTNGSSAVHHPNGTYMALLNIASAQYSDTGLYKCTVQNQYGASSGNVTLSVKGIPAMPAIVRVNLTSDDVVIVSWVPGYDGGSDVMYYSVQFRMNSSTSWKSSKVPGNTTLILLTRPSEEGAWKGVYVFRVTAVNQYGPSEASKVQVTLGGDDKVEVSVPEKRKDDDSLTGAVAGGVAGGVLLIILVIVLVLVRLRRKKRKSPPSPERQVYYSAVGEEPSYTEADGSSQGRSSTYSYVTIRPDAAAAMAAGGSEYASVPRQKHWEVPKRNVRLDKQLGSGHFGKVMKGFLKTKAGTKVVAVKMLKEKADEQQKKEFLAELELMKSIAPHPNIVGLVGCCSKSEQPYILVEFCTMGNLRDYLRSSHGSVVYANMAGNSLTLTCRDLMSFAWQSARGMSYLASQKLVHRDLAARNVLVDQSNVCKIADFGLARDIYEKKQYLKTGEAELPLRWMALESIFKGVTTTKSDVWSFGVLLWEIVTLGANPYPGMTREQLISQLHLGYRMPKPPFCTDELYSIMWQCWQEDPESRPSFLELGKTLHRLMTAERLSIDLDNFDVSYINAPEEE